VVGLLLAQWMTHFLLETRLMSCYMYASVLPDNDWWTTHVKLYSTCCGTGGHCDWCSTGV